MNEPLKWYTVQCMYGWMNGCMYVCMYSCRERQWSGEFVSDFQELLLGKNGSVCDEILLHLQYKIKMYITRTYSFLHCDWSIILWSYKPVIRIQYSIYVYNTILGVLGKSYHCPLLSEKCCSCCVHIVCTLLCDQIVSGSNSQFCQFVYFNCC